MGVCQNLQGVGVLLSSVGRLGTLERKWSMALKPIPWEQEGWLGGSLAEQIPLPASYKLYSQSIPGDNWVVKELLLKILSFVPSFCSCLCDFIP